MFLSRPSVRPPARMEQLDSHWTDFREILYLSIFGKSVEVIQVSLKSEKNNRYFTWRPIYIFDHISLNCFRIRNVSYKRFTDNQNTHFILNNSFFEKRDLFEKMWKKYGIAGPATDDSMAHAHCKLDN